MRATRVILMSAMLTGALLLGLVGCKGAEQQPAASADKKVTILLAHTIQPTDPIGQAAEKFKELAEKNSNGSITVQVHPNNELGGENQILEQLKQGSLQMTVTAAGTLGNLVPDISVLDAPYLWKDFPAEKKVMQGPIFKHFVDEFSSQQGIRLLSGTWYYGLRNLTSNKPVKTPADAAGLKIRTPPAPVNLMAGRVLGGDPTPMDFAQVYLALKSGTIDAQENPLTTIMSNKLYEVQKYIIMTKHQQQSQVVSMNLTFWNGLSLNQQKVVQDAVDQAADVSADLALKADDANLLKLKDMKDVTVITDPDYAAFRARAKEQAPQMKDKWGELYDQIVAAQQ
jgi:TRAP-type transport system periplasmic protein